MNRSFVIDLLKLLAAQAIVLHHLSAYGPMREVLMPLWPVASENFFEYSRLAVQVFLVMGGFLAAPALRTWQTTSPTPGSAAQLLWRRYLRLMPPYLVALACITLLATVLRPWISGDWLVDPAQWRAALGHLLTVQAWFDLPSLSVGVWYVAMDFHLYALLVLLMIAGHSPRLSSLTVLGMAAASMLYFNHHSALDAWPLYFFGAYGLGVLAGWSQHSRMDRVLFGLACAMALLALWIEPRIRLAIALLTALALVLLAARRTPSGRVGRWMQALADASYGTFLSHYGVLIVMSALWTIGHFKGAVWAGVFALLTWGLSLGVGHLFHRQIERRLPGWLSAAGQHLMAVVPASWLPAMRKRLTASPSRRTPHTPSIVPKPR